MEASLSGEGQHNHSTTESKVYIRDVYCVSSAERLYGNKDLAGPAVSGSRN